MHRVKDQRGIAHIVEIIIIAVIVLGVGGFIAWRVWDANQNKSGSSNNSALQDALAKAQCAKINDKDLCKFFTSWKETKTFKVTASQTANGATTTSTYESSSAGTNYHMTMTVDGKPYEVIGIGNTLYTKDFSDNKWWKQTLQQSNDSSVKGNYNYSFDENKATEDPSTPTPEPQYTKLGTEACGSLTCFKYQISDPTDPATKQFIWFDNKDYQLRRMRIETGDGTIMDQTFEYSSVNVGAPSPTKDLPAGQYLVPGQNAPSALPTAGDLGQ